ncbi:PEP-CTERM sorting domain-containing protein [Chitiniphilus eburneus]|uniref:PEP-CTERM sorting domain-containing protein n=2 Tax=Chitiniphilus eburneus TaxID=2571148 RepID=A0A4U0PCC1_9NEIS|nr:PEP-CTERM sorting domain-containing protein [Chitiniphilus eburneus]
MKQLGCALALALSPMLSQAAVIDVLGMMTLDVSGAARTAISQATVIRNNYSFLETTVLIEPTSILYFDASEGPQSASYSVNVSNNAGYAVSGFDVGAAMMERYSVKYFPANTQGVLSHYRDGEQIKRDYGQSFTDPGGSDYFLQTVTDFAPYSFLADINAGPPILHNLGLSYMISVGAPNPGWYGWALAVPATLTFRVYDPATVVPVPEPAAYALTGLGLLALWARRRRERVAIGEGSA